MSTKGDIAKEISTLEQEMQQLEFKRTRSMSALMEALISKREPAEVELQFFRQYSAEIDAKRERLIELTEQLKNLM